MARFEVQPVVIRAERGLQVIVIVGQDIGVRIGGKGPRRLVGALRLDGLVRRLGQRFRAPEESGQCQDSEIAQDVSLPARS